MKRLGYCPICGHSIGRGIHDGIHAQCRTELPDVASQTRVDLIASLAVPLPTVGRKGSAYLLQQPPGSTWEELL